MKPDLSGPSTTATSSPHLWRLFLNWLLTARRDREQFIIHVPLLRKKLSASKLIKEISE
jgi:hypothetical protein